MEIFHLEQFDIFLLGIGCNRFRKGMFRVTFGRCGQAQKQRPVCLSVKWINVFYHKVSVCEGARLVKGDRIHLAHPLQGFARFDDHSVFCGLADCRHDCRGRGEHQRTGAEYHQDSHRPDYVFCHDPCCDQQRHRHKPACRFIRDAGHGCLFVLRLLHHADELLQRAVLPQFRSPNLDCSETVDCAAEDTVPHSLVNRQRFPRHDGLIHRGRPLYDITVNRNGLAGENAQNILHLDFFRGNHFFLSIYYSAPLPGRKADKLFQAFLRPFGGLVF